MSSRSASIYFAAGVLAACTVVFINNFFSRKFGYGSQLSNPTRKRVLFFGDSITQHGFNPVEGWISNLAYWWSRRVDILNRGFSGYNSKWGLSIVKDVVISEAPDLVFVFFGANDAVDQSVIQHVPLADYKNNIIEIILKIKKSLTNIPMIIITPPPVWEPLLEETNRQKGRSLTLDRTNERTRQYANACKDIGLQLNVPVIDLWTALQGDSIGRQDFLIDGLHLNTRGNIALFQEVKKLLGEKLPAWTPDLMPMHMPEWSQISAKDPKFV